MLNFEGADLREVVKNILGDILNESYTIDATTAGTVIFEVTGATTLATCSVTYVAAVAGEPPTITAAVSRANTSDLCRAS